MPFKKLFNSIFKKKQEQVVPVPTPVVVPIEEPKEKKKPMEGVKSWIKSKTIWAILVGVAPVLTKILGFDVNATITDIMTIVTAVMAIYFRIKATDIIK
jgi:hypothetical protein